MSAAMLRKVTFLIRTEVQDFDKWKEAFDAMHGVRSEAGLSAKAYSTIDEPNHPCIIGTAPSKEAFLEFFSSPQQQERIKAAGVLGMPKITFLTDA